MKKKHLVFATLFVFALAADQLTKVWARSALQHRVEPITIITNYFDLRYSENLGSAFGLFRDWPNARYLLLGVGVLALGVIVSMLKRTRPEQLRIAAELGLLGGGAVGNIVDRVLYGKVTDFILWHVHSYEWPVFNIADAALVVGVGALLIDMRHLDQAPTPTRPAQTDAPATPAADRRARGNR